MCFRISAVTVVLLESRLGCLHNEVSKEIQAFIDAVGDMFRTGHQLMVFAELHKMLATKIWKNHVDAWDTIYRVGEFIRNHSLKKGRANKLYSHMNYKKLYIVSLLNFK